MVAECRYADTGVGQPWHGAARSGTETERFAQGADQDQRQQDGVEGMGTDQVAGGQDLVQLIAAHHMAEQHHPGQQAKPAGPSHHQRHIGTASSVGAVVPVADQQEREQAGQFPENTIWIRLPEITSPSMAPMNARKKAKKRGTGSSGDM